MFCLACAFVSYLVERPKMFSKKIKALTGEIDELKKAMVAKDELYENLKFNDNHWMSKLISLQADYLFVQYEISQTVLKNKKRPAKIEAQRIKELAKDARQHFNEYKAMLYKYEKLLNLFPELSLYLDDFSSTEQLEDDNIVNVAEDIDRVINFITKDEYLKLGVNERNHLAFTRYLEGSKTKWQIGRDYEMYCGYTYETDNWNVNYFGIEKRLEDLGRDLIAIKDNVHHIIQCKYWSREKLIHEKHITQLFGTSIEYQLNLSKESIVIPVLTTNIKLSEKAKIFAEILGVEFKEEFEMKNFPRIKCNITKNKDGADNLIYHLPFDQQYDTTKINKPGEFYAFTVEEAVNAGFRRAYRYFNNS